MLRWGRQAFVLLVAVLAIATVPAGAAERIALLIGNQNYNAKVGPLQNPHNDVALVGAALRSLQFKVAEIKDADYGAMDKAINRHIQAVRREGKGSISLVYYAGHGAANPDTKINYLIPVDVANAEDEELWTNSINLNRVVESLREQAPSATHYVVFDACRNELNLTSQGKRALADRGFVPIAYTPGVMIAYATAPGKTATDAGVGAGIYAKALAEEIVKPGLEAVTMFRRVALRVNREIGQDPWMAASTLAEVYLAGEAPTAPPLIPPSQPQLSEAERAWQLVKDTPSIVALEAFVRRYGGTFQGDLAKARLEEIMKVEVSRLALESKKKADEEARAKVDAERQRLAMLKDFDDKRGISDADIIGNWCGSESNYSFSRKVMIVTRVSDSARLVFNVTGFEPRGNVIEVLWQKADSSVVRTAFGEFSSDRKKMVQLSNEKGPRREFRRC